MNAIRKTQAPLLERRIEPVLITIVGAGGAGKSTLAKKIARMLTRSQAGPNVLLIDADIYNRGLTTQFESVRDIDDATYLHDAIVGGYSHVLPVELCDSHFDTEEWPALPEDGRIFFLPLVRKEVSDSNEAIRIHDLEKLKSLLSEIISDAVQSCRAECVVIDTVSIPEKCSAVFASISQLLVLVHTKGKTEDMVLDHYRKLSDLVSGSEHKTIVQVSNQIGDQINHHPSLNQSSRSHCIPTMKGLERLNGEEFADNIDFDCRVVSLLTPFMRRAYPKLVPSWCVPLPSEWRKVALALGGRAAQRISFITMSVYMMPIFLRRLISAAGIGIPALACFLLSFSVCMPSQSSQLSSTIALSGLAIGLFFLALAAFRVLRSIIEYIVCLGAAIHLAREELDWVLASLRLKPKHFYQTPPEKRRKLAKRKLNSLNRTFDTLRRFLQETQWMR